MRCARTWIELGGGEETSFVVNFASFTPESSVKLAGVGLETTLDRSLGI